MSAVPSDVNCDVKSKNQDKEKNELPSMLVAVNNHLTTTTCNLAGDGSGSIESENMQSKNDDTQEVTNSDNFSTDVDEEEDDINSFAIDERSANTNFELQTMDEKSSNCVEEKSIQGNAVTSVVDNDFSNFEEEEKLSSLFENDSQTMDSCFKSVDATQGNVHPSESSLPDGICGKALSNNTDGNNSLQGDFDTDYAPADGNTYVKCEENDKSLFDNDSHAVEEIPNENGQSEEATVGKNSSLTLSECVDESANFESEKNESQSSYGFQFERSGEFSGFSDEKKEESFSSDDSQATEDDQELSNFDDGKRMENGFNDVNGIDSVGVLSGGDETDTKAPNVELHEKRVFIDFAKKDSHSEININDGQTVNMPNCISNNPCDDESRLSRNGDVISEFNQESQLNREGDDSHGVVSEIHQQSSQDVTSSVPGMDKQNWSDGDSSPGRLQIDAEEIPEPTKSDDDLDPNALTIDMGELEERVPEAQLEATKKRRAIASRCDYIDEIIENVVKGNVSPSQPEIKLTIPLKRKRPARKMKRTATSGRLAQNNRKPVQKWHISSMLKCPRCPMSSFSTVSDLLEHQRGCGSRSMAPTPSASGEPTFKMPKKVYRCSACGSYYENWNLFTHMNEVHKKYMCMHCLVMFNKAAYLAHHLSTKHQIWDQTFVSGDELSARHPGPHFMLCCRCDRMCTDKDFESHSCSSVCSHCGLAGTHYPTCRLAPQVPPKPSRAPRKRSRVPKKVKVPPGPTALMPLPTPPSVPVTLPIEPSVHQDLRSPAEELSPTTFNERMLQLYRVNRPPAAEKNMSSVESIEQTINSVIEASVVSTEDDDSVIDTRIEAQPEERKEPSPVPMEVDVVQSEPEDSGQLPQTEEAPVMPQESDSNHSDVDTSDSEKLTMPMDNGRPRQKWERSEENEGALVFAGEETPYSSVPLNEPLNVARIPIAMKLFVRSTSLTCVYCAHARKIAVNGKQLALHLMAQHRYITVAESASPIDREISHSVVIRCIREALSTLESVYFNAYGYDSSDKTAWRSADRIYECFHCCFSTPDSKEFLSHIRKIHQKESLFCVMCKTRFITYSELLCHLCGGVYTGRILDPHLQYRCYACDCEPLPSSFQLMVHLRRMHTACDMCFATCESQVALHAHVQKHKFLFHCYACAITYRTRQEMTKHIFWKHGAESVTCKRCLQKKWKHAYHFCLPPAGFPCEECAGWFQTSSALRVHKRLHQNEFPHGCTECSEKFISRKLLAKHAIKHEPPPPPPVNGSMPSPPPAERKKKLKKKKAVADLFDLPPVNLSESDDSSEDEKERTKAEVKLLETPQASLPSSKPVDGENSEIVEGSATNVDNGKMWDGVLAGLEGNQGRSYPPDSPFHNLPQHRVLAIMLGDHDYCRPVAPAGEGARAAADHDYCNNGMTNSYKVERSPRKTSKRRTRSSSSESSSSSNSSCSCASSNCSCSSSSSSTESASSGEPRPPRRKVKEAKPVINKSDDDGPSKGDIEVEPCIDVVEGNIQESDLETDEPVTDDDDFYEKNPALKASEILEKNRNLLVGKLKTQQSVSSHLPSQHSKSKSKQGRSSPSYAMSSANYQELQDADTTEEFEDSVDTPGGRRPRRKRVPLKYYGFSSGDDDDFVPVHNHPPRKKERLVEHNTTIPAPPEPPVAPPSPEPSNLWNPPSWRPPPVPPKVNPIKIRTGSLKQTFAKSVDSGEFTITRADLGGFQVNGVATEGARSGEKLYCFCQCPYDEVSEMIACDAVDCRIEWFHFECVGIMVPPKGKWYCPDCKKKAAAESEMMGLPLRPA